MTYKQLLDLAIKTGRLECDGDYVVSGFSPSTYECDEQELYQYILMGTPPSDERSADGTRSIRLIDAIALKANLERPHIDKHEARAVYWSVLDLIDRARVYSAPTEVPS